jgi:hypothetical protein
VRRSSTSVAKAFLVLVRVAMWFLSAESHQSNVLLKQNNTPERLVCAHEFAIFLIKIQGRLLGNFLFCLRQSSPSFMLRDRGK